jgi:putative ABC transport system substrate-binding protein
MRNKFILALVIAFAISACGKKEEKSKEKSVPVIGFVQTVEDETISDARRGFLDALSAGGFDSSRVSVDYKNAQGDNPTLNQIIDQFIAKKVSLIAANTTVAMQAALGKTKEVPIFMMVAPSPTINNLTEVDSAGRNIKAPKNLSGVYETLTYIDSNLALIKRTFPKATKIGVIYNSSEMNSTNAINRLRLLSKQYGFTIEERAISATIDALPAAQTLSNAKIDVFFAPPDNVVFNAFETIVKTMNEAKIPIVSSEAGLVKRGAAFGYGADFYQWGYQCGAMAAEFLKEKSDSTGASLRDLGYPLQTVKVRKFVHNDAALSLFGLKAPEGSVGVK